MFCLHGVMCKLEINLMPNSPFQQLHAHASLQDRAPLVENPPSMTPAEERAALDAASAMLVEAQDEAKDVLKACRAFSTV